MKKGVMDKISHNKSNPVFKNSRKFNKNSIFRDRSKYFRKQKHKELKHE